MKVVDPPVMDYGWALYGVSFCHVYKINDEKFKIEYFDTIRRNCVGTANLYINKKDGQIACADNTFFDKGVFFKIWGFAEDFNKKSAPLAMLCEGKWYLKENGDSFNFEDVDFSTDGQVQAITLVLYNNYEKKEITIRP